MSTLGDQLRQKADSYQHGDDKSIFNKIVQKLGKSVGKGGRSVKWNKPIRESVAELLRTDGLYVFYGQRNKCCECNYAESCGHHPQQPTTVSLDNQKPVNSDWFTWRR